MKETVYENPAGIHSYLLHAPKFLFRKFKEQCKQEGISMQECLESFMSEFVYDDGEEDVDE